MVAKHDRAASPRTESAASKTGRKRHGRKSRRGFAKFLCVMFALIGLVPLGAGILVRTSWVKAWAVRQAVQLLRDQLGLEAQFEASVRPWPLSLVLSQVVVLSTDGSEPALRVEQIVVQPKLFSLLQGRFSAGDIEVSHPSVRLVMHEGKLTNLQLRPQPPSQPQAPSTQAPFASLAMSDARLDLVLEDTHLFGSELDLDVTASEGPSFDVALRSGALSVDRAHPMRFTGTDDPNPIAAQHEDIVCQLDARLRVEPSELVVRRLRLKGSADTDPKPNTRPSCDLPEQDPRRVEFELRSSKLIYDSAGPTSVSTHLSARAPLALVNRFVPFLPLQGWVGLQDIQASWERGQRLPDIAGRLQGAGIVLGVYRIGATLQADINLDDAVLHAPKIDVGFADGLVSLRDVEVRPLDKGIPLKASSVELDKLQFSGLMRDLGVTDHTHVRLAFRSGSLTGVEGSIEPLRIESDLVTHVSDFEVYDKAFDDPQRSHVIGVHQGSIRSRFVITPAAVEFQNSRVEFGRSHLGVFCSLGFSNDFRLSVSKGSHIDLADVSPLVDLNLAGAADLGVQISGQFSDPLITSDLSINRFVFADLPVGDLQSGHAKFQSMALELSDVRGKKGSSPYRVPSMRVDFNGPAAVLVDASIESNHFDLRDFFSVFHFESDPRFEDIFGVASTKAKLRFAQGGPLDRCGGGWLSVQAQAHLSKLDLYQEHYDEGDVDLEYRWVDRYAEERGVEADIRSAVLRKGRGLIVGSGTIRQGGQLRVQVAASDVPLSSVQSLGPTAALLDASVSATAQVTGTLDQMAAEIDARMTPLRVGFGTAAFPASTAHIRLEPTASPFKATHKSRCGQPIPASFDINDYRKDRSLGVFHIDGDLFGGQLRLQDLQLTRQRSQTVKGQIAARQLDLGKILQVLPSMAKGQVNPQGAVSGLLSIDELNLDSLAGASLTLALSSLSLSDVDGAVSLHKDTGPIRLQHDELTLPNIALDVRSSKGMKGTFLLKGKVHRLVSDPSLELSANLEPTDISFLSNAVPRIDRASGMVQASLDITGSPKAPHYAGQVSLQGGALALHGLPTPLDQLNLLVRVSDREIKLDRATARLGGGTVSAVGTLPVEGLDFGTATAMITARQVSLPVVDGVSATLDADLTASWSARLGQMTRSVPRVVGEVSLRSFEYTRPISVNAELSALAQRAQRTHVELYDPDDDVVDFEVRVRSAQPLRLHNNLADVQFMVDSGGLLLSGSNQRAGLRGGLTVKPGGRLQLRNYEFEVRDGSVRFDDVTRIAPAIDVTAVTEYRRYSQAQAPSGGGPGAGGPGGAAGVSRTGAQWRIQLHAHGEADNLRLDLTSEPGLAQEDILLLLTLGVTRAELDQMGTSSVGESAALEALSSLTGADTVVRETIPVIDDFRFGSAYSSRSGRTEPTVTVGKRMTDRVRASVTSGLSESREVRSNLEWELTHRTSVMGSYDNVNNVSNSSVGNLGADIRFRITFE